MADTKHGGDDHLETSRRIAGEGIETADIETEELRFRSDGEECAATLYRSDTAVADEMPCVVMGNGFSLTRHDGMPRFAERFADRGIAALTFDFRHLGDSDGEPRQLIDYQRQRSDLAAAVAYARTLDRVDGDRIAVWGYSFGGGHVLPVAAQDDRLAAVISMFPMLDGLEFVREYGLRNNARYVAAAARAAIGRRPIRMAVTGPPGAPAVLNHAEAEPGFDAVCAEDSRWRNVFLAKPSQSIVQIRPVRDAPDVQCPLLFCLGTEDTMMPLRAIERAADRAPQAELLRYPCGHFDGFLDAFKAVVGDQFVFLDDHLDPSTPA